MNKISKYIFIIFSLFIYLQFSSCHNNKKAQLIYHCYTNYCAIVDISNDTEEIIIPKVYNGLLVSNISGNAFDKAKSLKKVYYEGTLEDWYRINIESSTNPIHYAEEIYFLDENGEYYLVEEIYFDKGNVNMENFIGFDCLKSLKLSKKVKSIDISLNNDLQNLVKVYYEGTLEDWFNLNFSKASSNPMYYAEEIYFLDKNGEYYLVEEICFDSNIIDISNIRGFNCLKRIYLSSKFKEINCDNIFSSVELDIEEVYYEGTLEDWLGLDFASEHANPLYYTDNFYLLNSSKEYYLLEEIIIPENITEIKNYQFVGVSNLKKIILDEHIDKYGKLIFLDKTKIEDVYICKNYDFNVNIFGDVEIKNLYFDGTIEEWFNLDINYNPLSIAENAYFKNMNNEYFLLRELTIPSEITHLNGNHINGYKGLETLYIPDSVEFIEPSILKDCQNINKIVVSPDNKVYDSRNEYNGIIETTTNKIIFGGDPSRIPETVEEIGEYSFIGNDKQTMLIHPNIKILPKNLYNYEKIKEIYYEGTLEDWFKLSKKHFFMNIDNVALYLLDEDSDYYEVKEIRVPKSVTIISANYFSNIKKEYSIYLHDSIEEMYADAFVYCEGIKVYYEGTYDEFWKIKFNEITYHIGIYWKINQPLIFTGEFFALNECGEYVTYYKQN